MDMTLDAKKFTLRGEFEIDVYAKSEEDAKRILDAFSEKEKGYQKEKRRIPKFKAPYVEQDW